MFKTYFSRILGCYDDMEKSEDVITTMPEYVEKDDEENGYPHSAILLLHRQEMRKLVGDVIFPPNAKLGSPGVYIPLYYEANTSLRVSLLIKSSSVPLLQNIFIFFCCNLLPKMAKKKHQREQRKKKE